MFQERAADKTLIEDLQMLGASDMQIAKAIDTLKPETTKLDLPRSMKPLIQLISAITNQWKLLQVPHGFGAKSVPVALDYQAVDTASRWLDIPIDAKMFESLKRFEYAALSILQDPSR